MDAAEQIDAYIAGLGGWQQRLVRRIRDLVHRAEPALVEQWKWDTPVFSGKTNVLAVGVFKDHIKVNFFKGAWLPDPHGLFNSGLEAKAGRTIDLREGDDLDEGAFTELVREAAALGR